MIKDYFALAKPGIIFGNLITAAAGFFLASRGHPDFELAAATFAGLGLIIASGCVFNNYIDRKIDQKMARTKNRALASGAVSKKGALIYGIILLAIGIKILLLFSNFLALGLALTGFFFYTAVYSFWKRVSIHSTVIGSVSGAVPPLVGYTTVTNNFDLGALLLFFILVCWQMPHFYAIGIYRLDEYVAADIPILPVKKGVHTAKVNILCYIAAFAVISPMLTIFGYTGTTYFAFAGILGILWLALAVKGFWAIDDKIWARKIFKFSLLVITILCIVMALDAV